MSPDTCLATVTSDSFVAGTMTLLHSFCRHHPGYRGDVVVIADELSDDSRRHLSRIPARIRFLGVSPALKGRVDDVVAAHPSVAPVRARFHALEAFRLRGYEKVLLCDSDLLFRGSVDELFAWPDPLVACGDIGHYVARLGSCTPGSGVVLEPRDNTFNSGLMLIGQPLLSEATYAGLLRHTHPATFTHRHVALADQAVFNVWFESQARLAPGRYNYLLACHETIAACEGTSLSQARVIHFNFGKKPWVAGEALLSSMHDPAVAAACAMWLDGFADCLKELALKVGLGIDVRS